ncbi:MAG: SufD family Fe-S cluster assembly protein [Kosmotoga sp.]|nr:MAG: SufD family Fe-S cluster assembly protein [Kosmotoga sp.]
MIKYSSEFEQLTKAYKASGGNPEDLQNYQHGLMLVSSNEILGKNEIDGLEIKGEKLSDGVKAQITVKKGYHLKHPVHLCFGIIPETGIQRIIADFVIEKNANAVFLAHCSFPNAKKVQHIMEGNVYIGENAFFKYDETHFHGNSGGVEVLPKMKINVAKSGQYVSNFKLIKGSAGVIKLDYEAYLSEDSASELYAKVYGKKSDDIQVKESIYLNGKNSRGLAKSRIVLAENAKAEILGEIVGRGSDSRGHVDCMEIIQGNNTTASAVPKLQVVNETAKLTHEAAIGSVDKHQVETLMARGLTEQEAIDTIVSGLLK